MIVKRPATRLQQSADIHTETGTVREIALSLDGKIDYLEGESKKNKIIVDGVMAVLQFHFDKEERDKNLLQYCHTLLMLREWYTAQS